jgi:predicted small secreted protein
MKKLLLVLMVVALASFLFVGCLPTTPAEGEGEGEGEAEICPTVAVTSQVAVGGKNYIKAGTQTITVTFAVPTEPVSVFVGGAIKGNPEGIPDDAKEVIMYADADKKVYTGTYKFFGKAEEPADCDADYIYVLTCETCAACKYPYTVDKAGPETAITITSKACTCTGCDITFKTPKSTTTCGVTDDCCGDYCSGFASYTIDLYTADPFDACCDVPCITPKYSCTAGVACPVDCVISCADNATYKEYWTVVTLLDVVGNRTRYYAILELDSACGVTVTEYTENKIPTGGTVAVCTDWTVEVDTDATIGACL